MSKDKTLETVQNVAAELAPALWGPFSDALAYASMQLADINHGKHPALRPLVARARLRDLLEISGKLPTRLANWGTGRSVWSNCSYVQMRFKLDS